jgi:hypothetical protein
MSEGARPPLFVADLYGIEIAPRPQGSFLGFRLEIVPLIERVPQSQQFLESGIGAPSAEKLPNLVKVVGQELAGEVQRERLPEIELSLVRDWEEFLAVVDVIRQTVQIVAELGMIIELPRLQAEKSLMLLAAVGADEFEGFP